MKVYFLRFAALALLFGCASAPRSADTSVAEISIQDISIIYRGGISGESNERLFELVKTAELVPTTLVITSKGGETIAGIELGRWVFRNGLDVTVSEYCLSSCANYVFAAGHRKTLEPSAAVVWHGGATQREWGDPCSNAPKIALKQGLRCADIEKFQEESLEEFRSAEESFFAEIGVDQRITILGQDPQYDCRESTASLGWYYSIDDMGRLGIQNVHVRQGKWRPKSPAPNRTVCRVRLGADFS